MNESEPKRGPGRPRIHADRHKVWRQKTNFESSDRRRGYKAGNCQAKRGGAMPDLSAQTPEYQEGYRKGFESGKQALAAKRLSQATE